MNLSIKRVALATLGTAGVLAVTLGVTVVMRLSEASERVRSAVQAELTSGTPEWRPRVDAWAFASAVEPFALPADQQGNAARLLWPNGVGGAALHCPLFYPLGADAPQWDRARDQWMRAAACEQLDAYVEAARMRHFDVLAPEVRRDAPIESLWSVGSVSAHRGILTGIGALLARARLREEQRDLAGAEHDLRALIALGIKLVQFSPSRIGLEHGHKAVNYGLDHLAALYRSRRDAAAAAEVAAIRDRLPPLESCRGLVNGAMPQTAAVPEGFAPVAAVVRDEHLPLAVRLGALHGIQRGYLSNPFELVLGPAEERVTLAQDLARETSLEVWREDLARLRPSLDVRITEIVRAIG